MCTGCDLGLKLESNSTGHTVCVCPEGQFGTPFAATDTLVCGNCDDNCLTCSYVSTNCTSCGEPLYLNEDPADTESGNDCVADCSVI